MIATEVLDRLVTLVQPWADAYADSKLLPAIVLALHLGGMLTGGGFAIACDRAILRTSSGDSRAQRDLLADLQATHGLVIPALAVMVVSGGLFLAADLQTFANSWVYWTKMTLVVLLLANGLRIQRAESRCRKLPQPDPAAGEPIPAPLWNSLRRGAVSSLVLWFSILIAGTALTAI